MGRCRQAIQPNHRMGKKFIRDISASSFQVIATQVLAFVVFVMLSRHLEKSDFGALNWVIATLSIFLAITGSGMDLIAARRVAAGKDVGETVGIHLVHVLAFGSIFLLLLPILILFSSDNLNFLMTGMAISLLLGFVASPFKQVCYGKRKYFKLAWMNLTGHATRCILIFLFLSGGISLVTVTWIYIASSAAELLLAMILGLREARLFPLQWTWKKHKEMVEESLPQWGVVFFNAVLARFDWMLLGIASTTVLAADYFFAYKAFEISRIPLLVISPLLMPVFTRIFTNAHSSQKDFIKSRLLYNAEMFISVLIPLILGMLWIPLVEKFYGGKYGIEARTLFWILSLSVPLQFATDYYWNLCFAQGQLRLTMKIALASAIVNIALNAILIPSIGSIGAACSFVAGYLLQWILFIRYTRQDKVRPDIGALVKTVCCASAALAIGIYLFENPYVGLVAVIFCYLVLSWLTRNLVFAKLKTAYRLLFSK